MNIQVGTSSISGVQLGDTGQVDLQTLMATVMLQKTDLLDQQHIPRRCDDGKVDFADKGVALMDAGPVQSMVDGVVV